MDGIMPDRALMKISFLLSLSLLAALSALAQQQETEQRILVPIETGQYVDGAHGSVWRGVLTATNHQQQRRVRIRNVYSTCMITCPTGVFTLEPGASMELWTDGPMILTYDGSVGSVSLSARVFDVSRQFHDWGTEVPLVSTERFRPEVWLLNVPRQESFRLLLRVFESDGESDTPVRVRLVDPSTGVAFSESILTLTTRDERPPFAFGQSMLLLPREDDGTTPSLVHIQLSSPSASKRIWGFVSVTHNETQRVTLVTPQPIYP
jgi:hypothetical protein